MQNVFEKDIIGPKMEKLPTFRRDRITEIVFGQFTVNKGPVRSQRVYSVADREPLQAMTPGKLNPTTF
jgi:hypothetical protein